ncbi:hypothetical protein [Bifidobacterium bohemicum]|nr:hypothetical protein [Bifidobacterium bohemicum]
MAELQKSFTDEDRSDMLQSRTHELFRRGHNAYVAASLTGRDWDAAKLNERLDGYYQGIARSLPLVANAEIATRQANSIDEGDETTSGKSIGLIRYTFATPRHDWFANTLLLPAGEQEAVINMACDTEQLPARAIEFMSIADSAKLAGTATSDVQAVDSNL